MEVTPNNTSFQDVMERGSISPTQVTIFRAPLDNDKLILPEWQEAGLENVRRETLSVDVHQEAGQVRVATKNRLTTTNEAGGYRTARDYTFCCDGRVHIAVDAQVEGKLPCLPRIGLEMRLAKGFENVTWYGRGPHENYVDRRRSARMGIYTNTVTGLYEMYVKPQANGHRSDVRWAALRNGEGRGLLVVGDQPFGLNASHYTESDLASAEVTDDLSPIDEIVLTLDHKHRGVGQGSCCGTNVTTLPQYRVPPRAYQFAFTFIPIQNQEDQQ